MQKIKIPQLFVSLFIFSGLLSVASAADEVVLRKTYSRGDDDLAYTYRTAYLRLSLALKKTGDKFDAKVTFLADLSTEEAQGFAESVRFGMREAKREFRSFQDESWREMSPTAEPLLFKFVQVSPSGLVPDEQTQRLADSLSNNALRTGFSCAG